MSSGTGARLKRYYPRLDREVAMRLVIVSNRVACPKGDEPIEGGLAAALLPAVRTSGAIWVGSSGRFRGPADKESFAKVEALGTGAVATIDLPRDTYQKFYEGFANSALWPVLHSRTDLIRTDVEQYTAYREINSLMARAVLRFARPDAMFWIHDYHYLTLGSELRRLGIEHPVGFFLHTPFPVRNTMVSLPHHRELVRAMLCYDLIGFQTEEDVANFADYLQQELGLTGTDSFATPHGVTRLGTFPIGIDVESFAERAVKSAARPEVSRLRSSLQGARLVIGVDRVDYSKGLPNRLRAFDRMLQFQPALKRAVTLLQIAVPSRAKIDAYRQLQEELAALDPGVLVLSKFAGAARQLDSALLVNPHDIDAVARAISNGLGMPNEERRERWGAMMETLQSSSLKVWMNDFVSALTGCPRTSRFGLAPDLSVEPPPRRRAELAAIQNR